MFRSRRRRRFPKSLQKGLTAGFCSTDSLDHNDQAVQFVLCFLRLKPFHRLSRPTQKVRLRPIFPPESRAFDCFALGFKVRNSGQLGH
jgi:hypothetical protein